MTFSDQNEDPFPSPTPFKVVSRRAGGAWEGAHVAFASTCEDISSPGDTAQTLARPANKASEFPRAAKARQGELSVYPAEF